MNEAEYGSVFLNILKVCVHHLSRCTTSPKYKLYQLNKKMSLQSLIFFDLKHCHFQITWRIGMSKRIPLQKSKQLFGLVNLIKMIDYKYINLFFWPLSTQITKINITKFFSFACQEHSVKSSIIGCDNKQVNNSEVTYFHLTKDPHKRKSCLAAISRDKGNLSSNVLVCPDHFEDKYFDKSWNLQNRLFYTDGTMENFWD